MRPFSLGVANYPLIPHDGSGAADSLTLMRTSVCSSLLLASSLFSASDAVAGYVAVEDGFFSFTGIIIPRSIHGWSFKVNRSVVITHLGLLVGSGDGWVTSDSLVGLFRVSDAALLTSGLLPQGRSNPRIGSFRYVEVPQIALTAGEVYAVAYTAQSGQISTLTTSFTTGPGIEYIGALHESSSDELALPTKIVPSDRSQFGPNFQFEIVPEPATFAMTAFGLLALAAVPRRRN